MANVNLTQQQIDYIARVVETEVPRSIAQRNPAEYQRMVGAVVDTITNRMASGDFPTNATDVMNQPRQFSKITGPSHLSPYGSVQNAPAASPYTRAIVDDYVAGRAAGTPSLIGGSVNYANPNASDRSNLLGWVNPMIERGAQMFGIGQNVHYHGTAPGYREAGPYTLVAEGMPGARIATPLDRPQEPVAAPLTPVERLPLEDVQMPKAAPKTGRVAIANPFDPGRFASPAEVAFDQNRFGAAPNIVGTDALRRGLLDQQLDAGILPSLAYEQQAQPAYVDPMVTTSAPPQVQGPAQVQGPVVPGVVGPAPGVQAPAPQTGLLSAPETQQVGAQRGILGPSAPLSRSEMDEFAAHTAQQQKMRSLLGGIGGGLLGGLALGPLGAIGGGLLGRNYAKNSFFPDAPNGGTRKEAGLSDYGRSVQRESKQFDKATKSGKGGLW